MKHQIALIFLLLFSYVLEYDYFVYSDTESSVVNRSSVDKLLRKPKNFVCKNLNNSLIAQDNQTKCFNTSLASNESLTEEAYNEEITTELYSDDALLAKELDDEEEDEDDDEDSVAADTNYNASFNIGDFLNDRSIEIQNLTRIKPTVKLLPVEGQFKENQIIEFDWDLDLAEDKHKWHHKKKKKKHHHHHHHKKKHKHKHKEKHKHKHKEKHKHVHWHKHKEKHEHKHKEKHWHKHKHKKESWHKHKHEGKHKHDHGHKSKHKHKHESKHKHHKKKKKKKKGW